MSDQSWSNYGDIGRGEIRLNTAKGLLVRVIRACYVPESDTFEYLVEEFPSGVKQYWLHESVLGPSMNEMEALAWVAK